MKTRGLAAALVFVTVAAVSPASVEAQTPASPWPHNTYVVNTAAIGYAQGYGFVWVKAINYYGLGLLQAIWNDPTWGYGALVSWFDYCGSVVELNNPAGIGVTAQGIATTSANPSQHLVQFTLQLGMEQSVVPPSAFGFGIPGEVQIGGPIPASHGYAMLGWTSCQADD